MNTFLKKIILLLFLSSTANTNIFAEATLWNRTGNTIKINGCPVKNHGYFIIQELLDATKIQADYYNNGNWVEFCFESDSFRNGCTYQVYGTISRGDHITHDQELVNYLIARTKGACSLMFSDNFFNNSEISLFSLFCLETGTQHRINAITPPHELATTFNLADWSETQIDLIKDTDEGMIFLSHSPYEKKVISTVEVTNKKGIRVKRNTDPVWIVDLETSILQFDYVESTQKSLTCPLATAIIQWFKQNSIRSFSYKTDYLHNLPIEPVLFNLSLATLSEIKYYNIYGIHDETISLNEAHGAYFKWQIPGSLYKTKDVCLCKNPIGCLGKKGIFEIGMTFGATGAYTRNTLAVNHFLFIPNPINPDTCIHSENIAHAGPAYLMPPDAFLEKRTVFARSKNKNAPPKTPAPSSFNAKATPERDLKAQKKMTDLENSVVEKFDESIQKAPLSAYSPPRDETHTRYYYSPHRTLVYNQATQTPERSAGGPEEESKIDSSSTIPNIGGLSLFESDDEDNETEKNNEA